MPTLFDLPIYKLRESFVDLKFTRHIFFLNYKELNGFLDHCKVDWTQVVENPWNIRAAILDVARLTYNFIACAMTLKDHTNRTAENVFGYKLLEDYKQKTSETFSQQPVCGFVQDLRNYSLHRSLPIADVAVGFNQSTNDSGMTFLLQKPQLLQWNEWNARSRRFLDGQSNDVLIDNFTNQYFAIVKNFHTWLDEFFIASYQKELNWLDTAVINGIKEMYPGDIQEEGIREFVSQMDDLLTNGSPYQ